MWNLRELLRTLPRPDSLKARVLGEPDRVSRDVDVQERRRRQRALLRAPNPHGDAAADLKEAFDAVERQPVQRCPGSRTRPASAGPPARRQLAGMLADDTRHSWERDLLDAPDLLAGLPQRRRAP